MYLQYFYDGRIRGENYSCSGYDSDGNFDNGCNEISNGIGTINGSLLGFKTVVVENQPYDMESYLVVANIVASVSIKSNLDPILNMYNDLQDAFDDVVVGEVKLLVDFNYICSQQYCCFTTNHSSVSPYCSKLPAFCRSSPIDLL